jgi:DNA-binding IclR family transcriptional regulator
MLYEYPITTAKQIVEKTGLPLTSVNRLLNMMVEEKILITDGKQRNRKYIYYGLLEIIR